MNRSASRGTDGERGVVVEFGERCAQRTVGRGGDVSTTAGDRFAWELESRRAGRMMGWK